MDEITLKNFRCFREEQTARLAPLTLLVGENSTGKTSFMAMIRALWDVAYGRAEPDFKEEPYDLGSFDEIAHHRGGRGGRADTFEAGFKVAPRAVRGKRRHTDPNEQPYLFEVAFKKKGTVPSPVKMRLSNEDAWGEVLLEDQSWQTTLGTSRGRVWKSPDAFPNLSDAGINSMWLFIDYRRYREMFGDRRYREMFGDRESEAEPITFQGSELPTDKDWELIDQLVEIHRRRSAEYYIQQPYASAPVRSKPRRTYDPARLSPDSEGEYVPMYLAGLYFQDQRRWTKLKDALESFGQAAGLFDEISIKPLGRRDSEPFQVQVRKYGGGLKGPQRNLIDVGYGVSQMLPVITELLRHNAPPMLFLLQQPEVHLHPSAQAALGSLFCQVAKPERQLVVETHSDHLLDRVRMDVRDSTTPLKPDDVSILFFERGDLDVHIHSLRIDEEGNIEGAPDGYRNFFLEETARSLWKRQSIGT